MKVAIVTTNSPERHREFMEAAHPGMECTVVADAATDEEKLAACRDAEALILATNYISLDVLKQCPNLKLVQGIRAGYDRIDIKGMSELGIVYANNGGSNALPVAEHAFGMVLGLARGIVLQARSTRDKRWNEGVRGLPVWEFTGKRVGIVGLGPIGQAFAKMLIGFECDTVYYKTTPASAELEAEVHARYVPLDELMSTSDVISVHVSLTASSRKLIGAREIALMKPSAVIVNTSRGAVIDETALYEALRDGRIGGAGLDVLEQEPTPIDNPLLALDNVIVTPHQSGFSRESAPRGARFAFDNVRRALTGEPVQSIVKP